MGLIPKPTTAVAIWEYAVRSLTDKAGFSPTRTLVEVTNLSTSPYVLPAGEYFIFAYNPEAASYYLYLQGYIAGAWRSLVSLNVGATGFACFSQPIISDGTNLRLFCGINTIIVRLIRQY